MRPRLKCGECPTGAETGRGRRAPGKLALSAAQTSIYNSENKLSGSGQSTG